MTLSQVTKNALAVGLASQTAANELIAAMNVTPGTAAASAFVQLDTSKDIAGIRNLTLGVAGSTLGALKLSGNTSGVVTVQTAAAAGTWTLTLPADDGDAGEQLQTNGSGVATWEAAGSLPGFKNVLGSVSPAEALQALIGLPIHRFKYKRPEEVEGKITTTGDYDTEYVGVMATEAPFLMHHNGRILNPINALGYLLGAVQALHAELESLKASKATPEPVPATP